MEQQYSIRILNLLGYITPFEEKITKLHIFYFIFLVPFTGLSVLNLIYFYQQPIKTLSEAIVTTFLLLNTLLTLFRRFFIHYKKQELTDLINQFDATPDGESEEFNELEREMKIASTKRIKSTCSKLFNFGTYSTIFTAFAYFLSVLRAQLPGGFRAQQYPIWWPNDIHANPDYYFICAFELMHSVALIMSSNAYSTFMYSLMLALAERSGFLARVVPQVLLPGPQGQVTPQFRAWVMYHQRYLKLLDDVNEIMNKMIFFTILLATSMVIALIYMPFSNKKTWSYYIGSYISVFAFMTQILMHSAIGQKIVDKSVELRGSVVSAAQVSRGGLRAGPACSALQVLVTRVAGGALPEEINAMGYFPLNMDTFTFVLNGAVGYLLTLFQLKTEPSISG